MFDEVAKGVEAMAVETPSCSKVRRLIKRPCY